MFKNDKTAGAVESCLAASCPSRSLKALAVGVLLAVLQGCGGGQDAASASAAQASPTASALQKDWSHKSAESRAALGVKGEQK